MAGAIRTRGADAGGVGDLTARRRRVWVSRSPGNLVVRYADGTVLKGYSADFDPEKPSFHLVPTEYDQGDEGIEVRVKDLKAVFFVRRFEGDPDYNESKDLYAARPPGTRKVTVEFEDGEVLVGYTTGYDPSRPGFFFSPLDPRSNNLRVFAVFAAVTGVIRLL